MAAGGSARQETLEQTLQRALDLHGNGDLAAAVPLYEQVLQGDPDNPDALHLSGVAAHQSGTPEIAEVRITRAIALMPDYAEAYCNLGNALQDLGRFDEAADRYREAIAIVPDFAEAHGNLGNALKQLGQRDGALASYRMAVQCNPEFAGAHGNLGDLYLDLGRLEDAVASYRQAIAIAPGYADAHGNLGTALQALGQREEAIESYRRALAAEPGFAEAHAGLANTLRDCGRLDDAIAHYREAVALKPDNADVQCNLGVALQEQGWLDEAISCYGKALTLNTDFAEAYGNLGTALKSLGRLDDAIERYRAAIRLKPDFAQAHGNLGVALLEAGDPQQALISLRAAIAIDPANDGYWSGLAAALEFLPVEATEPELRQNLWDLLDKPTVRPAQLLRPVIAMLRQQPAVQSLLEHAGNESFDPRTLPEDIAVLAGNRLLLKIMASSILNDLEIEALFTSLRRRLLQQLDANAERNEDASLPFRVALALHCFTNEYVLAECTAETATLSRLCARLEQLVESGQNIPESLLVTVAAYRPLYELSCAQSLLDRQWSDILEPLIARQLDEPLKERAIADDIPQLTRIDNAVSQAVRGQYEENPYPRWIRGNLRSAPGTIRSRLQASPLCLDLGDFVSPSKPAILIAGCGTGQQALSAASRFADASILAIDLSARSLAYAIRKTREQDVTNIDYAQADILALGALGRQFDLIECSGVLHHLEDPMAGWRVLVSLLRSGGLIKIGLYSEAGRRSIVNGRALVADKEYLATPDGIRSCRQEIIAAATMGDGAMRDLLGFNDFFSLSECRDLLFHVQEHRFTLPQIEADLRALDLEFLGFDLKDQHAMSRFKQSHPEKQSLSSLELWHAFECQNPDTFKSMYQFWCRKKP